MSMTLEARRRLKFQILWDLWPSFWVSYAKTAEQINLAFGMG